MQALAAGAVVDQYRLVRPIGQGGFGTVWLAYSEVLGAHVALKALNPTQLDAVAAELEGVRKYKAMAGTLAGLMPIEHVGVFADQVFYVMPLADGMGGHSPESIAWQPCTLAAGVERQRSAPQWLSPAVIASWLAPICCAAQALADAGLVHRDIKPDNILFFRGRPVLSDVSLLRTDSPTATRLGTPGYSAPSWYAETGGKLDMFSLAATLFTLLTGHSPDKLGRAAFRWPPQGEASLDADCRESWLGFHRVVLRATHERPSERYLTFTALADAIMRVADPSNVSVREKPASDEVFRVKTLVEIIAERFRSMRADTLRVAIIAMCVVLAFAVAQGLYERYNIRKVEQEAQTYADKVSKEIEAAQQAAIAEGKREEAKHNARNQRYDVALQAMRKKEEQQSVRLRQHEAAERQLSMELSELDKLYNRSRSGPEREGVTQEIQKKRQAMEAASKTNLEIKEREDAELQQMQRDLSKL